MTDEPKASIPDAPKKKRKRVDPKHLKVARGVARGLTLQEAGEVVGYPARSARQSAWKGMETIKRKAPEIFDELGLTVSSLAQDVDRLRRAKETKFFHDKGIVMETREVEALDIQAKAVDMGLRVHGAYKEADDARNSLRSETSTVCLVVTDAKEAAELARLLAPRDSSGVVIDVAPQVDSNLG